MKDMNNRNSSKFDFDYGLKTLKRRVEKFTKDKSSTSSGMIVACYIELRNFCGGVVRNNYSEQAIFSFAKSFLSNCCIKGNFGDEEVSKIYEYLKNPTINIKKIFFKVKDILKLCKNIVSSYEKKKQEENNEENKTSMLKLENSIKKVKENLEQALSKYDPRQTGAYYKELEEAYKNLCEVAKSDSKIIDKLEKNNSVSSKSSNTKGLTGWYKEYQGKRGSEDIEKAIFAINSYQSKRFGFKTSRLRKLYDIVEKLKKKVGYKGKK